MSKDYISPEHAIRNIMNSKSQAVNEEQQLDEYSAIGKALSAAGAAAKTLSGKAFKTGDDIIEIPAPVKPKPTAPAPAKPKTVPAEPTPAPVKPAPAPAPAKPAPAPAKPKTVPDEATPPKTSPVKPNTGLAPRTGTSLKTGTSPRTGTAPSTRTGTSGSRTGGTPRTGVRPSPRTGLNPPGFTPGQDVIVGGSLGTQDPGTYKHMAGEYRVTEEIKRTEIENVARPNSDRNKVMSRNQAIKKQIIDETARRKKIIKDTVNLKPETNDSETNEVYEQVDASLANKLGLDPNTGMINKNFEQPSSSKKQSAAQRKQARTGRKPSAGEVLKQKTAQGKLQSAPSSGPKVDLKGKLSNLVGGKLGAGTSALGAGLDYYFRRQRGESVPRALGGAATGALGGILGGAAGAGLGSIAGPAGTFTGGLAGGAAGFYGAGSAYDSVMDKLFGKTKPQPEQPEPKKMTADERKQARHGGPKPVTTTSDTATATAAPSAAVEPGQRKEDEMRKALKKQAADALNKKPGEQHPGVGDTVKPTVKEPKAKTKPVARTSKPAQDLTWSGYSAQRAATQGQGARQSLAKSTQDAAWSAAGNKNLSRAEKTKAAFLAKRLQDQEYGRGK